MKKGWRHATLIISETSGADGHGGETVRHQATCIATRRSVQISTMPSKPSSAWAPPPLPLAQPFAAPFRYRNQPEAGHAPTNPAKPNRRESGSLSSALGLELLTLENSSKFGRREWLDGPGPVWSKRPGR